MQSLIDVACEETKSRSAYRLTPTHVYVHFGLGILVLVSPDSLRRKRCILANEQFDFLKDVVENVPDEDPDVEKTPRRGRPKYFLSLLIIFVYLMFAV